MSTLIEQEKVDDPNLAAHDLVSNAENTQLLKSLFLQQRGNLFQEQPNAYNISVEASRPGTVDSDTLELMLRQANQTFVPTRTFKDIRRSLEKNCHVTICGASGEGKTTMALMLGEKYITQGYELVFVNKADVFDLGSCISSGQKLCLIVDDIFGSVGQLTDFTYMNSFGICLKMHITHNLLPRQRNKAHAGQTDQGREQIGVDDKIGTYKTKLSKEKSLLVIFTAKTYNFKEGMSKLQYQRLSMFNMKTVVDLTLNPETSYSQQEKKAMVQKHRENHPRIKLRDLVVEDVANQESTLFGFPLTCRLFFEFQTFTEMADDFFKRPLFYLRIELNDILSRRNDQSAALILVLLCEENIKLPELESPNINKKVDEMLLNVTSFTHSATRSGIADAARNFRGTFLSRGDNLTFAHSSIYEACACSLFQFNPSFVLKYCSLDFLYERLKPGHVDETGVSDRLHYLFVSEEYFHFVVTRLITSMKQGVFSKTVAHPMNQNETFVEKFLEELRTFASEEKEWIQWKENGKGFLYWVVRSKSTTFVINIEMILSIRFTQEEINEALSASVVSDSLTILKYLVERLDKNLDQSSLKKLLIASAESCSKDMVTYLHNIGAGISGTDMTSGENRENLQTAKIALDEDGRTPLMLAALHGSWDCFKQMQDEDSDVHGNTLIHLACYGGNKNIVERVLTSDNINSRGQTGRTPLMILALLAKSEILDILLSSKADTNPVDDDGNTVLHYACVGVNKYIVERLVTSENINKRNNVGLTAIMIAAWFARSGTFDLLSNNADMNRVDDNGNTVFHYACAGGSMHIVERIFISENINRRGYLGLTAIMIAAGFAKSEIFDFLYSNNADTTFVDNEGETLLHIACCGGSKHIVERLLTPENINSRGRVGRTPIMNAAVNAKSEVFDLLLSNNANTTHVDNTGASLIHLARAGGSKHIVECLVTSYNSNSRGQFKRNQSSEYCDVSAKDIMSKLSALDERFDRLESDVRNLRKEFTNCVIKTERMNTSLISKQESEIHSLNRDLKGKKYEIKLLRDKLCEALMET